MITCTLSTHTHTHTHTHSPLHLLCIGTYAIQSVIIACIINSLLPSAALHGHPITCTPESLPLPLSCALLISILVASMAYPHYIYSGKSTMLFLICAGYDAVQVTVATMAIYSLAVAFN